MSFSISLMRTSSPREALVKEVTEIMSVSGTLKNQTSIIDPVITIECNLSSVTECNYMYIEAFKRYYFIDNIRSLTNNLVEFTAHVDVLNTYAPQIKDNFGIVKRQENDWNLYLDDGSFKVYQNPMVLTKAFPSGFTTQEFVLAVAGS